MVSDSFVCMNLGMDRGWKPNVELSPNCPRCGCSNTKFCYYNNYSLTQPRYFCKGCRRYWTKGGSLRNVPVGGGCRKNRRGKSSIVRLSSSSNNNDGALSKSLVYVGHLSCDSTTNVETTCSSSTTSDDGSHIDLALVYANFLNPQQPDSKTTTSSSGFEIQELGSDHFDLTNSISNANLNSSNNNNVQLHIGDNNILAGCITGLADLSMEPPLTDNDQLMYFCGVDSSTSSIHKQQAANDHKIQQCTSSCNNHHTINNYNGLPPLPGEEVGSQEILWSNNSPLMDHQQQAVIGPETQDPNSLLFTNWSAFGLSGDHTFSRS